MSRAISIPPVRLHGLDGDSFTNMRQTEQVNVVVTLWLVFWWCRVRIPTRKSAVLRVGFVGLLKPSNQMLGKKLSKLTTASFPIPFNSSLISHPSIDAVCCNMPPQNVKRTPSAPLPPQQTQYESLHPRRKSDDVIQLGNFCCMSNSKTLRIIYPSVLATSELPLLV